MLVFISNRTEWSPIRSVIIRVIKKIGRPRSGSSICLSRVWLHTELDDTKSYYQLRATASNYQTSPDSSKKSTSILFDKKNLYIELFSKMEFKRFSEFHFSRNREISDFAQMGLGANPKIGKFCECWAASQSKIRKEIETLFYTK